MPLTRCIQKRRGGVTPLGRKCFGCVVGDRKVRTKVSPHSTVMPHKFLSLHHGAVLVGTRVILGGVFTQRAHSAGTAPIITVIIQVTTLKTTHLRNHAQSIQNSKIQTSDACHGSQEPEFCPYSPVQCSSHSMTSFQSSELTELPVVENSQLFAQRTVRPLGRNLSPHVQPMLQMAAEKWGGCAKPSWHASP